VTALAKSGHRDIPNAVGRLSDPWNTDLDPNESEGASARTTGPSENRLADVHQEELAHRQRHL
jgi:hypothetical protein